MNLANIVSLDDMCLLVMYALLQVPVTTTTGPVPWCELEKFKLMLFLWNGHSVSVDVFEITSGAWTDQACQCVL